MSKILILAFLTLLFFSSSHAEELIFEHGQHRLYGQYLGSNNGKPAKAVLLFVHGDGAMSYDAEGYYNIIWKPLRESGYAIFSWDKPNVGDSSGNWLKQSMKDRQSEVLSAIEAVQNKYHFTAKNTGLFGFSQAGWVVPALANNSKNIGFIVGVGFAKNWIEQGRYLTKAHRRLAGENKNQIASALDAYEKDISLFHKSLPYSKYLKFAGTKNMTLERYQFVLNNFEADATYDYSKIKVPSLFLWGENDLNVNAKQEYEWWQINSNKWMSTKLIPHANHGMLNVDSFDTPNFGFLQWVKLMWLEQDAFAPEFLPTVLLWLEQRHF